MTQAVAGYRERVMGCWLGKAIGGTLGAPVEGREGPWALTFYEPVPRTMLPNDDLDLQVVWACVLDRLSDVRVDRHVLGKAWLQHVGFPFDEYGVCIRNMHNGIAPPVSGQFDNWFTEGMGAAIRSEIWACLAPGQPDLAAAYAYEDACVDHAGEGIYAEMFLAAAESAAFAEMGVDRVLDAGLAVLPPDSRVRRAVQDTRAWWKDSHDWQQVRRRILERYDDPNFTNVVMNMAFTVLGLLDGGGDFSRTICTAVNCGKDTDCTGATAGALLGIMSPGSIDPKWLAPIGRSLVVNREIVGIAPPATLDGFTDLVVNLRQRLGGKKPTATTPPQRTDHLAITAEIAFVDQLPAPNAPQPTLQNPRLVTFPGTIGRWPAAEWARPVALLRYRFWLANDQRVAVMVSGGEAARVWVDGVYRFGRDGGQPFRPTPHWNWQPERMADMDLPAGWHELVFAVARPSAGGDGRWVVAVADAKTRQWLPEALVKR